MNKKVIATVLSIAAALSFTACKSKDETQENNALDYVTNSFENVADYYRFGADNLGRLDINTDANFVTDGNASLLLDVGGSLITGAGVPRLSVTLTENGDNTNLKKMRSVSFDIFNETGKEQEIKLSLDVDGNTTAETEFKLSTGKNTVNYAPDVKGISFGYDLSKGEKLNVTFQSRELGEGPRRFYMDALTIHDNFTEYAPVEVELDENEFCSFEKDFQKYVNAAWPIGNSYDCLPTLSINNAKKYCKDGNKSLKAYCPSQTPATGAPAITFDTALCKMINWRELAKKKAKLTFWVYNTGDASMNMQCAIWNNRSHAVSYFPLNDIGNYGGVNFVAKKGWTKVEMPLENMDNQYENDENHVKYKRSLFDNVGAVAIIYNSFSGEPKTFYFDSFAFEFPEAQNTEQ